MKRAGKIATGFAVTMMMAGSAVAADVPQVVVPVTPPPPPAPTFDWAGAYIGAYGGGLFDGELLFDVFGVQAGYNFLFGDRFFAGAEIGVGLAAFEVFEGALTARAGAVLGDRLLAYVEAGIWIIEFDTIFMTVGGGAEFAVGNSLSLFAEAAWVFDCGCVLAKAGLNWHLGN